MLRKLLSLFLIFVAIILIFAATRPNTYKVSRSIVINTAPDKPFSLVNDFHQWPQWSPWQHLDPAMKTTYSGAASGPGAIYNWEGNKDVGSGRMEILNATPASLVDIKLHFYKPMQGTSDTTFTFAPEGNTTRVTWTMTGSMGYLEKLMCLFVSMDRMIGKDFEHGLQNLKSLAEK